MNAENQEPQRDKDWRKRKWRGIMLSQTTIDEYIQDMRIDTAGQYITQGVSFNKDDALQMNLLKQTLLTHGTFSGFIKHLLYNYFANQQQQQQQINVQQQFILQQHRETGAPEDAGLQEETVIQKNTTIQGNPELHYEPTQGGYKPLRHEEHTLRYKHHTSAEESDIKPQVGYRDMRLQQSELEKTMEEARIKQEQAQELQPEPVLDPVESEFDETNQEDYQEPVQEIEQKTRLENELVQENDPVEVQNSEPVRERNDEITPETDEKRNLAKLQGISKFLESNPNAKKPTN